MNILSFNCYWLTVVVYAYNSRRLSQKDYKFMTSLGYIVSSRIKNKQINKKGEGLEKWFSD